MIEVWKSWKWPRTAQITDEQIKQAQYAVDRWDSVKKLLDTEGWAYIKTELEVEFHRASSILGVAPDKLAEKQGYCQGVGFVLARIQSYQHAAEAAQKIIALAGTTKE
jgi:hypothetical protein